ncbi:branched-chain amino acid transport system II carrier protein [Priestia filamentosa]|uniref:branched-chain amino acid transport system II carrier protein n=1 Tax=Priestia filamentosa TaxID=1402861 RepID=UPI0002F08A3D|nr:branched-chain amino acid transport system II carrier protein [Priestia filamentosa]
MKNLNNKELLLLSFMLFSMFFGAGNLIFPAFLGRASGEEMVIALIGFIITAVGLPILGVMTIANTGSIQTLGSRVHKSFAFFFPLVIYVSIGPGLAIPRAGTIAYEMGMKPFLPSSSLLLGIYTIIFFALVLWLSLSPSKLVDRFGKLLTPILLSLILMIFVKSLITPLGNFQQAEEVYQRNTFFKGFLDGYQTMDALAALVFGIFVANAILAKGVQEPKKVSKYMMIAGLGAGTLLASIYAILAYLGGSSSSIGTANNGTDVLTIVMSTLFGEFGTLLLGVLFTLACLCVSIGLIISCSQYFSTLFTFLSYKGWATLLTIVSLSIANLGLNQILAFSSPLLGFIYPMAVVLIVLGLFDRTLRYRTSVYRYAVIFSGLFSFFETINTVFLNKRLDAVLSLFPLYEAGVGWVVPALLGIAVGFLFSSSLSSEEEKRLSS